MFELMRSQSRSAAGAILYVTVGTLLMIWSCLWYYYFLLPEPNPPTWQKFGCVGTILSGLAIAAIGLLFGLIGRGAEGADANVGVGVVPAVTAVTAAPVRQGIVASGEGVVAAGTVAVPEKSTPVSVA